MTSTEVVAESLAKGVVDFYIDKTVGFESVMYYANSLPKMKNAFLRKFLMLYFSKTTEINQEILQLLYGIENEEVLNEIIYSSSQPAEVALNLVLAQRPKVN